MYARDSSFWQCKVYEDIRGVLWRGGVKRHWVVENGVLSVLRCLYLTAVPQKPRTQLLIAAHRILTVYKNSFVNRCLFNMI